VVTGDIALTEDSTTFVSPFKDTVDIGSTLFGAVGMLRIDKQKQCTETLRKNVNVSDIRDFRKA
jgi:hypothetical protein